MEITNTLYIKTRSEWRSWLEKNFEKEKEIWLIFPNKASGKVRLPYNDAVEEALCFGWIDSIVKSLDKHHSVQRFTPRNPKTGFSQPNKERMKWLLEHKLVHPSQIEIARKINDEAFIFPEDIINYIKKDTIAWNNYKQFSEAYKRIRIAYIDSARVRPEEFEKRLRNFISKTHQGKMIGFGGIEKYY